MIYANIEESSQGRTEQVIQKGNNWSVRSVVSLVVGGLETLVSLNQIFHPIGFILGVLLLAFGIITNFYTCNLTKIPESMEERYIQQNKKVENVGSFLIKIVNIALILVTSLLFLIGVANLVIDRDFNTFPNECLPEPGCSRVACDFKHRDYLVNPAHIVTISGVEQEIIHDELLYCIKRDQGGTIASDQIIVGDEKNRLIHSLFISGFFGFIDDMYLQIVNCAPNKYSIEIQSVLRIGESDFEVNPQRVADMYECISDGFERKNIAQTGSVCG
mmetsp:Transcript_27186/g.24071  ORF Transcript_27186/g.24071 Transcript_27186/m.24071 type:complete len:274 (+) Transcript_27186:51-872(+)